MKKSNIIGGKLPKPKPEEKKVKTLPKKPMKWKIE